MRRGFKSQAEKLAAKVRCEQGISVRERIEPRKFLKSLGIIVWEPMDIPGLKGEDLKQLTVKDPDSWSGVTVKEAGFVVIIVNPKHSSTRQANTLMHEWAHMELRHKPNRVDRSENGLLLLSEYPKEIEEEADWLSAAILLPRDGLLYHCGKGLSAENVASHYGVSEALAKWRIGKTGVAHQLSARW